MQVTLLQHICLCRDIFGSHSKADELLLIESLGQFPLSDTRSHSGDACCSKCLSQVWLLSFWSPLDPQDSGSFRLGCHWRLKRTRWKLSASPLSLDNDARDIRRQENRRRRNKSSVLFWFKWQLGNGHSSTEESWTQKRRRYCLNLLRNIALAASMNLGDTFTAHAALGRVEVEFWCETRYLGTIWNTGDRYLGCHFSITVATSPPRKRGMIAHQGGGGAWGTPLEFGGLEGRISREKIQPISSIRTPSKS